MEVLSSTDWDKQVLSEQGLNMAHNKQQNRMPVRYFYPKRIFCMTCKCKLAKSVDSQRARVVL